MDAGSASAAEVRKGIRWRRAGSSSSAVPAGKRAQGQADALVERGGRALAENLLHRFAGLARRISERGQSLYRVLPLGRGRFLASRGLARQAGQIEAIHPRSE